MTLGDLRREIESQPTRYDDLPVVVYLTGSRIRLTGPVNVMGPYGPGTTDALMIRGEAEPGSELSELG